MTTITRENFTAAMERAVTERGEDFVYPEEWRTADGLGACKYSLGDGTPACIIGLALWYIDPGLVPDSSEFGGANAVLSELGVEDPILEVAARAAQINQDSRRTWGDALAAYKAELGEDS